MSSSSLLDPDALEALSNWIASSKRGDVCIVRAHAPGCGVTTAIETLLETHRCEPIRAVPGTPKLAEFLTKASATLRTALERRKKVIVFDPADELFADQTTARETLEYLKSNARSVPILCAGFLQRAPLARAMDVVRSPTVVAFPKIRDDVAMPRLRAMFPDADELEVERTWTASDGDFRACVAAMSAGGADWIKDEVCDGVDAIAKVLFGSVGLSEAIALHHGDSQVMSMGLFENYCLAAPPVGACAVVADACSAADVVDERIYGRQQWDLLDVHAAFAAGVPAVALPKPPVRRPAIEKVGVLWSRQNNQRAKEKTLRRVALAFAETGRQMPTVEDLAWLRTMCMHCSEVGDHETFARLTEGLGDSTVLDVMRLFKTKYTQSHHSRFKNHRKARAKTVPCSAPSPG